MQRNDNHFVRPAYSTDSRESSQCNEGSFEEEEDEDDDVIGDFIETETERCPHCASTLFSLYTTKGGYTVMKCGRCSSLYCPNCKTQLEASSLANKAQGKLHCQKCGALLG